MDRWEYKTVKMEATGFIGGQFDTSELEERLNNLGRDGWELASTFTTHSSNGYTKFVVAVLKRKTTM